MSGGYGYNSWCSIGQELVAYGTKAATWKYLDFVTEDIKVDPAVNFRKCLRGPHERFVCFGPKKVGGPITMDFAYEDQMALIKHAFGGYAFTNDNPVAGSKRHVFTFAEALPNYGLSMEICRADTPAGKVALYLGGKVDSLEFNFQTGEPVQITAGMIFKDETPNSTPSASPTYNALDLTAFWRHSGALTLINESTVPFKGGRLKISNNLSGDRFLMQNLLPSPLRGAKRIVEGTIDTEFESLALYTKFLALTPGVINLAFTSDYLITGTTYRSMNFVVSNAIIMPGGQPNVHDDGIVEVSIPWHGIYNGSTELLTITMYNAEATL